MVAPAKFLTPKEIAERFGCNLNKVLFWIKSGQLTAVDIALTQSKKPRWRISVDALADFERVRSTRPPAPPPAPRRRRADASITEYV